MGINISGIKERTPFDQGHWQIHGGKSFFAETPATKMAVADYIELAFKTPATTKIHMAADFQSKVGSHLDVYEGCNWSGGEGVTPEGCAQDEQRHDGRGERHQAGRV